MFRVPLVALNRKIIMLGGGVRMVGTFSGVHTMGLEV